MIMNEVLTFFIINGLPYGFLIGFLSFFLGHALNMAFRLFEI